MMNHNYKNNIIGLEMVLVDDKIYFFVYVFLFVIADRCIIIIPNKSFFQLCVYILLGSINTCFHKKESQ